MSYLGLRLEKEPREAAVIPTVAAAGVFWKVGAAVAAAAAAAESGDVSNMTVGYE